MAAITAFAAQAHFSEREVQVVQHNKKVFFGNVLLRQPEPDGFAAPVHIRRWLEQDKNAPFVFEFGDIAQRVVLKGDIKFFGEVV